jgi:ADP-heptose:LPS heptosyltransferase
MKHVLLARQDNNGDVLLTGPAVRAVAQSCNVTYLSGPRGAAAAAMLPGVSDVLVFEAAWIDAEPQPVREDGIAAFIHDVRAGAIDEAIVFTSFHQSPLPLALLLRIAGIARIGAISVDYPGSLLDVRHRVDDDIHEVERALSLASAMGYALSPLEDRRLRMRDVPERYPLPFSRYVVVHPGATVSARAWYPDRNADLVRRLRSDGFNVVVTGGRDESTLTAYVAGTHALDLGGRTTFAEFAAIVRNAGAVICGNTAAAHVAAAVGTPVVSIFPPTIPAVRFHPWMVPHVLLGEQTIPCAGCRARTCPIPGQPCLDDVRVDSVIDALGRLVPSEAQAVS